MVQFYIKTLLRGLLVVGMVGGWSGVMGQTYYDMSSGNYSQNFANIANTTAWPNGFNGTESQMWRGLAVNATGTIPSALRITTATTSFTTSTTAGVQRGSGTINLLTTGTTNNTTSAAIELYLDFTGRTAGTLSFDAACVFNNTGNRVGTLRVYASTDGSTYSELTTTGLPFSATNNVASSASPSVSLPAGFTNSATARLRFYYYNGPTGGTTGSRPKISIDNIVVTSSPSATSPEPSNHPTAFACTTTGSSSINLTWTDAATGTQAPAGYLIKWSDVGYADISNPTDGSTTNGTNSTTVAQGTQAASITGLTQGENYYFKIWSYTNSGSTIDYKTDGTVPQTTCETDEGPCLSQLNFTALPLDWAATSVTYASNEANFASNTGQLATVAVANPSTLTFDLRRSGNTTAKTLYVEVSTTSQTSGFDIVGTYNHSNTTASATTEIMVDLSAYTSFSTVFIRFRKASSTASPWYLKNVEVFCGATSTSPSLTTPTVTSITNTSATLGANVTEDGGAAITARGTLWGTTANPATNALAEGGTTTGVFTHSRTSLTPNTFYYFRGYGTNSEGTSYSADGTFTTLHNAPNVGTCSDQTTASLQANWTAPSGTVGAAAFTYEVEISTISTFASVLASQSGIASGTTNYVFSGLNSSTIYYYRVRANNAGGSSEWSAVSAGCATLEVFTPTLSATALTAFGSQCVNGTYGPNSFVITGSALTTANVTVASLAGYEFSTTSGGTYATSLNLTQTGGAYSQEIFVRFKPTAAISYNGNIAVGGGGASAINVAASGTGVTNSTPSVTLNLTSEDNPTCSGAMVTFTAVPANTGGGTVAYQWKNNGVNITGETNNSYSSTSIANGSSITCEITITGGCVTSSTALSNAIVLTVNTIPAAPVANSNVSPQVTNVNDVNFTANWNTVAGATGYFLDVYFSGASTIFEEDFTGFLGQGFAPSPSASQLSSNNWKITGMSDGPGNFGGTHTSGDFARGISAGNVSSGGTYGFDVGGGNRALGFQPTGSDFAPGTVVLRIQNNTGNAITSLEVSYNILLRNNEDRSSSFNFAHSGTDGSYIAVAGLNYTSPAAASGSTWQTVSRTTTLTGLNIANGAFYYLQWNSDDAGGSGSRDELALDDVVVNISGELFVPGYNNLSVAGTSQVVSGLTPGSAYTYRVRASNNCGASGNSNEVDVTTVCASPGQVLNAEASNCYGGGTTVSWQNPTCYDEILVVANQGNSVTFTPSGIPAVYNAYTANTAYSTANQIVFKGDGTSVAITGLTVGQNYTYKVFVREGNTWSSGVEVSCAPADYCAATSDECDEYIYNVTFNNIDNSSASYFCGVNGYSDYTSISTTVNKGETYVASISTGISADGPGGDPDDGNDWYYLEGDLYIWIDWNADGDFDDAGEEVVSINELENFDGPGSYDIAIPLTAATGETRMRIRIFYDNENDPCGVTTYGETEDYTINIVSPCAPLITVADFNPKSGPAFTWVNITGSGFNSLAASNAISINGVAVTNYTVIDNNLLQIEIPQGTSSAPIVFNDNQSTPCVTSTASNFTVLDQSGNCGSGSIAGNQLMISEVFDANSGSCHYIEIFNPTLAGVNLSGWNVRISTFPSNIGLSGILMPGETYIVRFFNQGCSACSVSFDTDQEGGGFNANDYIRLFNVNVEVDEVLTPNQAGFTMRRNPNITLPNTTFTSSEWSTTAESCSDLGTSPFNPTQTNVTITTQPVDIGSCEADFELEATTSQGTLTYLWKFNDGISATWSNLANGPWMGLTVTGATSDNLNITGGTSLIDGYQFYAEVEGNNTCIKNSNAAQFEVATDPYFRSVVTANNDWNDLEVWEISTSETGPIWRPACVFPTSGNSTYITIENGTTVNIPEGIGTPDASANQLIIQEGGTLVIQSNAELEIADGAAGADLVVEGTLVDNGTINNGIGFINSATWSLSNTGTFIKTGNSAVATNLKDNYEGGIALISPDATWIYRKLSTSGLISTVAAGMYYPNLIIENVSGSNWNMGNFTEAFTGGVALSSQMVVLGDLSIGVSGNGVNAYYNNLSSGLLEVHGDLYIGASSTFTNRSYDNGTTSGRGDGTGIAILGDFDVEGALDFDNDDTNANAGTIAITGNSDQIGTGGGSLASNQLIINKPSGSILTENGFTVAQNAVFTNGILEFDDNASNAQLFLRNGATHSGASVNSFVHGRVRKEGYTQNVEFEFPVGYYNTLANPAVQVYQPASLLPASTSSTATFDVRYVHENFTPGYENPNNKPPRDGSLQNGTVSTCNYWMIDRLELGPGINANVKLTWGNSTCNTVVDNTFLTVARWNGAEWDNEASSEISASPFTTGYVTSGVVTNFSPFTLGSVGPDLNILPITLLSFTAQAVNDRTVDCLWSTASEINNDFFTVERIIDGETWEAVGTVQGAGNSNSTLHYNFADDAPYRGTSYYRLRQTDFDGTTTLSQVEVVHIGPSSEDFALLQAYRSEAGLAYTYKAAAPYLTLEIFDISGRLLHGEVIANDDKAQGIVDISLARGVYLLRLSDNIGQAETLRFFY